MEKDVDSDQGSGPYKKQACFPVTVDTVISDTTMDQMLIQLETAYS